MMVEKRVKELQEDELDIAKPDSYVEKTTDGGTKIKTADISRDFEKFLKDL